MTNPVYIDVGEELNEHYQAVIRTRDDLIDNPDVKGSEKAALLNATTTIIRELAKMQTDLYNSGRIALLQQAIIEALKEVDPALQSRTMAILEEKLARL
jgi:hypothetical protein